MNICLDFIQSGSYAPVPDREYASLPIALRVVETVLIRETFLSSRLVSIIPKQTKEDKWIRE